MWLFVVAPQLQEVMIAQQTATPAPRATAYPPPTARLETWPQPFSVTNHRRRIRAAAKCVSYRGPERSRRINDIVSSREARP